MTTRSIVTAVVAGWLITSGIVAAAVPAVPPTTASAAPATLVAGNARTLERGDLEAWLDGFLPNAMRQGEVAGAVVVVVKDGQVLLQKGYGYADVAKQTPVDADTTLFRPGSVSKLFTWTALMQLVEQGKVNLDADVNTYLDHPMLPRSDGPITVRHLFTHTPGFEEQIKDLIASQPPGALGDYIRDYQPVRVKAAGTTPAYSNYGAALAGYIVERVSGERFDDYVERHLLVPLGMQNSSFRQPVPASIRGQMSQGYALASGAAKPYEYINCAPAGSMEATGADMARFMLAHLQHGQLGEVRILQAATAEQMHSAKAVVIPGMNSMLLGFYEQNLNGHRVIGHGGDTEWFHSELELYLDEGVGLFVSVNSAGREGAGGALRMNLGEGFADRYFPAVPVAAVSAGTPLSAALQQAHAKAISGRYDSSRNPFTSFWNVLTLVGSLKITANEDGTLSMPPMGGGPPAGYKLREVAPYFWRSDDGDAHIAARMVNDQVSFLQIDYPFMLLLPTPWWRSPLWLLPAVGVALLALVFSCLVWGGATWVRRRHQLPAPFTGTLAQSYRWSRRSALATVLVLLAWVVTFATLEFGKSSQDAWFLALQVASGLAFIAVAVTGVWHAAQCLRSTTHWSGKLWNLLLGAAGVVVVYVGLVFHVIGFTVHY